MNENIRKIKAIEDKYGLALFRFGLTHLVDAGHRNFNEKNIEESIKQVNAKDAEDKANGIISVMTPDFQSGIIHCAAELSAFSVWELFAYIKDHVFVSGHCCQSCKSLVSMTTENESDAMAENECPASYLSGKKKFLVLIDSSFVRDAQILPEEFFINEGDNVDDCDSAWKDWQGAIVAGVYPGCCTNSAIMKAADEENINPGKLIAYEIVE